MKLKVLSGLLMGVVCNAAFADHDDRFKDNIDFTVGAAYLDSEGKSIENVTIGDRDNGYQVSFGYSPKESLGFRLMAQEFGDITKVLPTSEDAEKISASSIGLVVEGRFKLGERHFINGNVGVHRFEVDLNGYSGGLPVSLSNSDTGMSVGFGYEFFFYKELSMFVDFKKYDAGDFDSSSSVLGLRYIIR